VNAGKPLSEWQEVIGGPDKFGPIEVIKAGFNPALQFLGNFDVKITPRTTEDGEDTITVTNTVSWESYWRFLNIFGISIPSNPFGDVCGDMKMIITWTEQVGAPPTPSTESESDGSVIYRTNPGDKENVL